MPRVTVYYRQGSLQLHHSFVLSMHNITHVKEQTHHLAHPYFWLSCQYAHSCSPSTTCYLPPPPITISWATNVAKGD